MTTIFTKADIQSKFFVEDAYLGAKAKTLTSELTKFKESGCYVVDVSLLETRQSGLGNSSKYLIRYVAPKFEVRVERRSWDSLKSEWWSFGANTERVFDIMAEAEAYRDEIKSEGVIVDIISHNPLDLPL